MNTQAGPLTLQWQELRRISGVGSRELHAQFSIFSPPVPLEAMVRAIGIQVHEVRDTPSPRWRGGARLDPDNGRVFVSRSRTSAERRLILAHQLGHMMLGPLGTAYADDVVTLCKPSAAREFAADLLMPWWLLEPYMAPYAKDEAGLARLFGVPTHSMSSRVLKLLLG